MATVQLTTPITVGGTAAWNTANNCIGKYLLLELELIILEIVNCNPDFLSDGTPGGYGCGTTLYDGQVPSCQQGNNGRYCTCPTGFFVLGSSGRISNLITAGTAFLGCSGNKVQPF